MYRSSILMKLLSVFPVLVMGFSVLFLVFVVLRNSQWDGLWTVFEARNLDLIIQKARLLKNDVAQPIEVPKDKLLDDLLPTGFDEKSCLSRYQSLLYRRGVPHKASPYLISKLRSYEARQKKCGPYTNSYNNTVEGLHSGKHSSTPECNYVVWIPFCGLGNQILSLSSVFLYALLTERVLLVDRKIDVHDLFCEPFPETSWLLPADFPLTQNLTSFSPSSKQRYGNIVKMSNASTASTPQPYVYLYLVRDSDDQNKLFFCDQDQEYLDKVPWLVIKSNQYFVPSLFMMSAFQQELLDLFPDKETVFHLLARYLFHPTNSVWGLITRYWDAYLSEFDATVGIQIRVFGMSPPPFIDQIISCTITENILPEIGQLERGNVGPSSKQKKKKKVAVMLTSLTSGYYEQLRDLYWENPTAAGEVIAVFQPSKEMIQQSGKSDHNRKAWAEMYLLSMTDKLVTSPWSTFGYVAQGLGGLKPWILYKRKTGIQTTPAGPPCQRAMSMEPCFHRPPIYDCKARKRIDKGGIVPYVRHCEDVSSGIKLVEPMF